LILFIVAVEGAYVKVVIFALLVEDHLIYLLFIADFLEKEGKTGSHRPCLAEKMQRCIFQLPDFATFDKSEHSDIVATLLPFYYHHVLML
jgi:hypothetical protein